MLDRLSAVTRDWKAAATVVGALALVLAGLGIGGVNESVYRARKAQSLYASAEVLARTVAPALVFDDASAAQDYVTALSANEEVDVAGVYDADGRLIARYSRDGATPPETAEPGPPRFVDGRVLVSAPVLHQGEALGSVFVRTRPEPVAAVIGRHAGVALLVVMASLLMVVMGAGQRALSRANRESEARAEDLAEAYRRLEDQIARRETAEEALRQSQKMEAIGQLTGGFAHDFNNLLQAMRGSLDLIRRRPSDADKVRRWAENGFEAADRGARLTAQLLAFSRAQKLELRPVLVSRVVQNLKPLLASTLGPSVSLQLELEDDTPVIADATQLELAVLNLAINARDAMPNGGVLTVRSRPVTVRDDPDLVAGRYMALSVSDTGAGMPADVRARAFDPFFTTKGVGKGTGLGLAQVYGIAKQAGGVARIDSDPGQGATVTLLLPCAGGVADAGGVAAEPAEGAPVVNGARVLVVDDDDGVRAFICEALQSVGYEVEVALNGAEALEALDRGAPDLVLLDFAMPGLNGAEVAVEARRRVPDLPILFASGYAESAALEAAVGPSAVLLRKPFATDRLLQAVYDAIPKPAKRRS
jgi:signal transduction histidine kinase/ActR/RegA family two-component response regulator